MFALAMSDQHDLIRRLTTLHDHLTRRELPLQERSANAVNTSTSSADQKARPKSRRPACHC
jgi:hypothetical protein